MAIPPQEGIVKAVVAIDKDKNSQSAVKWAVENLKLNRHVTIIHVLTQPILSPHEAIALKGGREPTKEESQQLFLHCRGYCARKGVAIKEVILQDTDIAHTLSNYIIDNSITAIVLGASNRNSLSRAFKSFDVPSSLSKSVPDFCTVYVVSKARALIAKQASRPFSSNNMTNSYQASQYSFQSVENSRSEDGFHNQGSLRSIGSDISYEGNNNQRKSNADKSRGQMTPTLNKHSGNPSQFSANNRTLLSRNQESPTQFFSSSNEFSGPQNLYSNDVSFEHLDHRSQMTPTHNKHSNNSNSSQVSSNNRNLLSRNQESHSHYLSSSNDFSGPPQNLYSNDVSFEHLDHHGQMTPTHNKQSGNSNPSQVSANSLTLLKQNQGSPSHYRFSSNDFSGPQNLSSTDVSYEQLDVPRLSSSSQATGDVEEEMRRLKQDLKQTMELYNSACKEVMMATEQVKEIDQWKSDEARKIAESKQVQEDAYAMVEVEKHKCMAALEAARMAQRLSELEAQKRKFAEMKYRQEAEEKKKALKALANCDVRYRKYTIEEIEVATKHFSTSEKIGEGGYGPVYKGFLDHTPVAIKVLRPDMPQGQKQFQSEIDVLSQMRHPHIVLLLGACPQYGCLVYEYMEKGSLEDLLFCKNGTPPMPWKTRFRIAAEITTALLFLHQTKPEPLVHRDLKPANILIDRNLVSKIGDVGLARLVPPSVIDTVTQYHMTAAAGTFCYIDPEYQQTGQLGTKSDVYSLGIMLLQIITAKPAMGLTYRVDDAIECGTFAQILDPKITDWPIEDALSFAKLAVQCCELRRKDRPDLGSVILPELERLRDLGEEQ